MLDLIPKGRPIQFSADRFSVSGQEISFMEDPLFVRAWNRTLHDVRDLIKDAAVTKIFWRTHVAISLISQIREKTDPFKYVECGIHLGFLSRMVINYFELRDPEFRIEMNLFDTFAGIPQTQIRPDEPLAHWHNENNYAGDVKERVVSLFPADRTTFHIGMVPDTLSGFKGDRVDFISLDMNIVEPEKAALEFFWPKLRPGGILLIDDYGFQKHTSQRNFYDRFFDASGAIPLQLPTGQAIVMKRSG